MLCLRSMVRGYWPRPSLSKWLTNRSSREGKNQVSQSFDQVPHCCSNGPSYHSSSRPNLSPTLVPRLLSGLCTNSSTMHFPTRPALDGAISYEIVCHCTGSSALQNTTSSNNQEIHIIQIYGCDKICMMTTRLACNRAIESSYWRMDNNSDVGLLMGYVLYRLPIELEFMDLDTFSRWFGMHPSLHTSW
jgi:hypothetical protein